MNWKSCQRGIRVAVAGTVGAVAVATLASVAQAAPASAGARTADCQPLAPARVSRIDPLGRTVAGNSADAANAAVKKVYAVGGVQFTTVMPPKDFNPSVAPVATLHAYGYEKLPKSADELAKWRAKFGRSFHATESVPCVSNIHHGTFDSPSPTPTSTDSPSPTPTSTDPGPSHTTYGNPLWGGFVDVGRSDYTGAVVHATYPTYTTSCGDNSTTNASPWVGIGGYIGSARLLQNGYDSGVFTTVNGHQTTTTNGARLWWEAINEAGDTGGIYIGSDHAGPGNTLMMSTDYNSTTGNAEFNWFDISTGQSWTPIDLSDGSHFYDGSSADFIDERVGGLNFRNFSTQSFTAASAAVGPNETYSGVFNYTWQQALLQNAAKRTMLLDHINTNSSDSFIQTWQLCN